MYNVVASSRFKKDLKLAIKRGLDISLLDEIVTTLQKGEPLPAKNKDHALVGNMLVVENAIFNQTGC